MRIGVIGGSDTLPSNEALCKTTTLAFERQLQESGAEIVNLRSTDELSDLLARGCDGIVVFPYKSVETSIVVQRAYNTAKGKAPIIFPQIRGAVHSLTEPLITAYITDHTAFTSTGYSTKTLTANTRTWDAHESLAQVLEAPFKPVVPAKHPLATYVAA